MRFRGPEKGRSGSGLFSDFPNLLHAKSFVLILWTRSAGSLIKDGIQAENCRDSWVRNPCNKPKGGSVEGASKFTDSSELPWHSKSIEQWNHIEFG